MDSSDIRQQQSADDDAPSASDGGPTHGSTGEGSSSAMAWLISREQARRIPVPGDEPPDESA